MKSTAADNPTFMLFSKMMRLSLVVPCKNDIVFKDIPRQKMTARVV